MCVCVSVRVCVRDAKHGTAKFILALRRKRTLHRPVR